MSQFFPMKVLHVLAEGSARSALSNVVMKVFNGASAAIVSFVKFPVMLHCNKKSLNSV
jgi:hypothetical protein